MSENIVLNPPTNLQYSKDDLIEDGNWKGKNEIWKKSKFDEMLTSKWNEAVEKGIFKYKLDDCKYRFIKSSNTDPLPCVAQLNPQRSFNRR
uniref:GDPGP1-like N-terminal domain-containing protein n=1 Tax=Ciona savignyi TaxID=51511 RepID=H2ZA33_CIOSA